MIERNKNKYNASGVWVNSLTDKPLSFYPSKEQQKKNKQYWKFFHSQHEYEVFSLLREFYPRDSIQHRYSICIKPASKNFKDISWVVDFALSEGEEQYLIEAKGVTTRDFALKASLLEYYHSDLWERMIIVYPRYKLETNSKFRRHTGLQKRSVDLHTLRRKLSESSIQTFLRSLQGSVDSSR